jgi:hypothetical protein
MFQRILNSPSAFIKSYDFGWPPCENQLGCTNDFIMIPSYSWSRRSC